jgi:hypothetical protein
MLKVKEIWCDAGYLNDPDQHVDLQVLREYVLQQFCSPSKNMYAQWRKYTPNEMLRDTQCICSKKCKKVHFLQNIYDPNIVIQVGSDCAFFLYDKDEDGAGPIERGYRRILQEHAVEDATAVAEQRRIINEAGNRLREIEQRRAQENRVSARLVRNGRAADRQQEIEQHRREASRISERQDEGQEVPVYMRRSDINQMARDLGRKVRVRAYDFV